MIIDFIAHVIEEPVTWFFVGAGVGWLIAMAGITLGRS